MVAVSVILPVYNAEHFIDAAIRSVLGQTYRNFEIIVIDDGSTDRSREIVEHFEQPIHYFHQPNRGAAAARNAGLSLARGDWIAFLDADDIWEERKLELQMGYARAFPHVSFFYTDIDIIDHDGTVKLRGVLRQKWQRRIKRNQRALIFKWPRRRSLVSVIFDDQPFPHPSTVLVRKDVLSGVGGFDPRFVCNYHEDFECFARIARNTPILFIPEVLVKYRVHPAPADNTVRSRNWFRLLQSLRELCADDPTKLSAIGRQFAKRYGRLAKNHFSRRDYHLARQYLRKALNEYGGALWTRFGRIGAFNTAGRDVKLRSRLATVHRENARLQDVAGQAQNTKRSRSSGA